MGSPRSSLYDLQSIMSDEILRLYFNDVQNMFARVTTSG
jgi:hypothetical protein